jgi:hypothetical protein
MHHAGLSSLGAKYASDIEFPYSKIPEVGRKLLFEMAEFARQMDRFSNVDDALNELPTFLGEGIDPELFFQLTKRHVAEFEDYVRRRTDQSLQQSLGIVHPMT